MLVSIHHPMNPGRMFVEEVHDMTEAILKFGTESEIVEVRNLPLEWKEMPRKKKDLHAEACGPWHEDEEFCQRMFGSGEEDHEDEDNQAYRRELNYRPKPSEY